MKMDWYFVELKLAKNSPESMKDLRLSLHTMSKKTTKIKIVKINWHFVKLKISQNLGKIF